MRALPFVLFLTLVPALGLAQTAVNPDLLADWQQRLKAQGLDCMVVSPSMTPRNASVSMPFTICVSTEVFI
jgi:hypothetical protein